MVPIRSAAIRTSTKAQLHSSGSGNATSTSTRQDGFAASSVQMAIAIRRHLGQSPTPSMFMSTQPTDSLAELLCSARDRLPQTTRTYVEIRSAKLFLTLRLTSTAMAQPTIRSSPTCPLLTTSARAAHWKICCPPTSTTSVSACDPIEAAGLQCASNMAMAFSRRSM